MNKGKIIVIEGGDSSGKATQAKLLRERLELVGVNVVEMDFPQYTENQVGALIRECLDGKHGDFMSSDARLAAVLYAADRLESLPKIEAWLQEGRVIIFDRYTSASMLHQGAKTLDPVERRDILKWIYRLEHQIMGLPTPDLLMYLNVPAGVRIELLQQQLSGGGRQLDLAEKNKQHQENVDVAAADMLIMYTHAIEIECIQDGAMLSREIIADMVEERARAILEI